jgi:hypothetical protein
MEDTDLKTRRGAIQQIVDGPRPKHEPEVQAAKDAYDEVRARSREAPMLEIRFRDGSLEAFDYQSLHHAKSPHEGKILLRFGRKEVIVEGKNLRRRFTSIIEHRQRYISEGTDEEEASKPEDASHIDRITIQLVPEDQL